MIFKTIKISWVHINNVTFNAAGPNIKYITGKNKYVIKIYFLK